MFNELQKPLVIFDLDGTLALNGHREHLIKAPICFNCNGSCRVWAPELDREMDCTHCRSGRDRSFRPNWHEYFRQCVHDLPNWPVLNTMGMLYRSGAEIRIWSGRSEDVRNESVDWLYKFSNFSTTHIERILKMRPSGDTTPDDVLKAQWLDALKRTDRERLLCVYDDRQKVVNMWRAKGVACFQVAPGDF